MTTFWWFSLNYDVSHRLGTKWYQWLLQTSHYPQRLGLVFSMCSCLSTACLDKNLMILPRIFINVCWTTTNVGHLFIFRVQHRNEKCSKVKEDPALTCPTALIYVWQCDNQVVSGPGQPGMSAWDAPGRMHGITKASYRKMDFGWVNCNNPWLIYIKGVATAWGNRHNKCHVDGLVQDCSNSSALVFC